MNHRSVLLLSMMFSIFICMPSQGNSRYQVSGSEYEDGLGAELDLGVVERELGIFDFFDQNEGAESHLIDFQEQVHEQVIMPLHVSSGGDFKAVIRALKASKKKIQKIIKRLKRVKLEDQAIFSLLHKRINQIKKTLIFMRKNRSLMVAFWGAARIEKHYGSLIASYKKCAKETNHVIVQSSEFEKELLYTSFRNISHKHRKYPTVYFMRRFLLKDIKKYKAKYERFIKKDKKGFAIDLFEKKYHDLTLVKTSIESLESYNKERKDLAVNRFIKSVCFSVLLAPSIVGLSVLGVHFVFDFIF